MTKNRKRIYIWTPTKGLSWATNLFTEGTFGGKTVEKKIDLFKLCSISNPKANLDVLSEVLNEITSYDELKMRLLGEFISLSGLIYGNMFNRTVHLIKPFTLDWYDYMVVRGLDPHLAKETHCVELAIDRMGFEYVIGTYKSRKGADVEEIKYDLWLRAKNGRFATSNETYRLGWTQCDKSVDYRIEVLGINIFEELRKGKYGIPALFKSEKAPGSIHAGVDQIKQLLKVNEKMRSPKLMIFDIPENRDLISSFLTLERETYANEDIKGPKDRIAEGRHDDHACLRYIHQRPLRWVEPMVKVPTYQPVNQMVNY
jgi:hypothetical protein